MKKYTSKQEYVAFYWYGSNVDDLNRWLNDLSLNAHVATITTAHHLRKVLFVYNDTEDLVAKHTLPQDEPLWIVISIDVTTLVIPHFKFYHAEQFENSFKEVKE